jgi:hypothetical protein
MKKYLFAMITVILISSACIGAPASVYNGEPTKIVTGEIVSVTGRVRVERVVVVDADRTKTMIDYQLGTTPYDASGNWPIELNSRVEVIYFVHESGRNVAISARLANQPAPQMAAQPVVQPTARPATQAEVSGMYAQKSEYAGKMIKVLATKKDVWGSSLWMGAICLSAYGAPQNIPDNGDYDWMITVGNGNMKMSDEEFASAIGDRELSQSIRDKKDSEMKGIYMWGGLSTLGLVVMVSAAGANPMNFGTYMIGLAAFAGGGTMAIIEGLNTQGYHISRNIAAEKALNYNVQLKAKLGLPKEYEPGL